MGFGTQLIQRAFEFELDGSTELPFEPEGLRLEASFRQLRSFLMIVAGGAKTMSTPSARLQGVRVLVVEDELVIALELEDLLSQLGCIPLTSAPTIQKALQALSDERPDVVVLDVDLQGERVTPVAIALNEQRVPFMLVTGSGSGRLPDEVLQQVVHLQKPVNRCRLRRALAEVLARHERGEATACWQQLTSEGVGSSAWKHLPSIAG
jgi:CheY-like chemotaxis protein